MNQPQTQYYCTLFDSAYLSRGLALYDSLLSHAKNFHLYVLAMDDTCTALLQQKNFANLTVVKLSEFETEALLTVKAERNRGEYCWTCTPFIIQFCLEHFLIPECTYLDADICFYSNPAVLLDEIPPEKSVLITEHRYTPVYDQSFLSGRFCVQFVTFKNTVAGMSILNIWAEQCLEWCFSTPENGRFGDQKYQDNWPEQWPDDVHILQHLGGGVAPWNVQQYTISEAASGIHITDQHANIVPLVFYHFHEMKFVSAKKVWLGNYQLGKPVINTIYINYINCLNHIAISLPVELPLGPLVRPKSLLHRYARLLKLQPPMPSNIIDL